MQHNNTEKDRNPAKLGDPQADQTTIPMQQIQRLPDSMQRLAKIRPKNHFTPSCL